MSFSFQFECAVEQVPEKLAEQHGVPDSVQDFVRAGAAALKSGNVFVKGYGHLHDGTEGNYKTTSATIEVSPRA